MARNRRGKVALYEVMSRSRFKPGSARPIEKHQPEKLDEKTQEEKPITKSTETIEEVTSAEEVSKTTTRWLRKPRLVQFNAGRVEFSMPYQIAIAIVLGLIVLILAAFRFGQFSYMGEQGPADNPTGKNLGSQNPQNPVIRNRADISNTAKQTTLDNKQIEPIQSTGSNVIVLVEHRNQADLVPAQAHFAENGILTEVVNWSGKFFLVTADRYTGVLAGSDGYKAIEKIKEVGAKYRGKAPEGFETFAPHYFNDAYGKKIN